MTVADIVERGAIKFGIELPHGAKDLFESYYEILKIGNRKVNLTAISGQEDVAKFHFLDSLALLTVSDFENARVIDVGSGAGFPGVPLKLAKPTIEITLLDSSEKRVAFLSGLCDMLGISAVCVLERAEESAWKPHMRESFDIAVSRALAGLRILCELCLPFIRVGGVFLAMKGANSDNELEQARDGIRILGAQLKGVLDYSIPDTETVRRIVIIKKTAPTPEKYPRRYARIKKTPL